MLDRNRFLVDHAAALLVVYNGERRGGTAATMRYAQKMGREMMVIHAITGRSPMVKLRRYWRSPDRRRCAPYFLRGCAGMSGQWEREATPSGVFDWTQSGQSGAWGYPNKLHGDIENDIPMQLAYIIWNSR